MRFHSKLKLAAILIFGFYSISSFADVYVICNSSLGLTGADIVDAFTGDKQTIGGTKLSAFENKASQDEFLAKVIKKDKAKYDAQWAKKSFRDGVTAPESKGSDAEVIAAVKGAAGGVGYVGSDPGAGVKVVQKF